MPVVPQTWVISTLPRGSRLWRSAAVFQRGGLWPTQFSPATAQNSLTPTAAGGQRLMVSSEGKLACLGLSLIAFHSVHSAFRSNAGSHDETLWALWLSCSLAVWLTKGVYPHSPHQWIVRWWQDGSRLKYQTKLIFLYLPKFPTFYRAVQIWYWVQISIRYPR